MQIAHVTIENFRQFEHFEADFTDSLGRVNEVSLLVGPNGSGKTTVLDAIALAIGPLTGIPSTRAGLVLTPPSIVRKGALQATVTCLLRFTPDEIAASREVFARLEQPLAPTVPDAEEVKLTWTYPAPDMHAKEGIARCEPEDAWRLLRARFNGARLMGMDAGFKLDWFKRAGRVLSIDQERTALGKSIDRDIWRIATGDAGDDTVNDERWTSDPRAILIDFAVKAALPGPGDDQFKPVQESYAKICAPRRIIGAVRKDVNKLDVRFTDGENEYGYDGVSSGEAMVLLFLIKMTSEHIDNSIVLVDELELHQHPVWQRRLLHMLPRMGESNQIIATTHSDYLRDVMPRGSVRNVSSPFRTIELGDLAEDATADAEYG